MAAVLVTGAAKGIGAACLQRLVNGGHHVFAGVRSEGDARALHAAHAGKVTPLILDVTDRAQIDAAAPRIREQLAALRQAGLDGVVNNAGIVVAGPLEFLPIEELRRQFEVNVIGQLAVTQAVLPMIRAARGRIVFIGSIAGRSALPITGPYSASKFALEALTDALRVELSPWGLHVSIIEPGVIATPIWETSIAAAQRMLERMPPTVFEYYGPVLNALTARATSGTMTGLPADVVARAVEHALFARKPKTRYLVGRDARVRVLLQMLPDRVRDRLILNQLKKL